VIFSPSYSWSSNQTVLRGFEVDRSKIQLKEEIGRGSYGVVYKAAIENVK
jgi:lipid-binding SYLF domain-containing protein